MYFIVSIGLNHLLSGYQGHAIIQDTSIRSGTRNGNALAEKSFRRKNPSLVGHLAGSTPKGTATHLPKQIPCYLASELWPFRE